jgi:hypothetical protein
MNREEIQRTNEFLGLHEIDEKMQMTPSLLNVYDCSRLMKYWPTYFIVCTLSSAAVSAHCIEHRAR